MVTQARPENQETEDTPKFGRSGTAELSLVSDRVAEAILSYEKHPKDPITKMELANAELERELFYAEHDNAGAFKFKKFGRRVGEMFKPGPDGKAALELDENGDLRLDAAHAQRRMMLVNMGELDRFNKEGGGHAAGDEALKATAQAIEQAVEAALKGKEGAEAEYQMYRFDGNTFAVDLAKMPLADFGKLIAAMQDAQPSVKGVKDPAPLTVRGLDFKDAVQMVNHVQAELPAEAKLETGEEAARELVGVLRRSSDWDMETHKFLKRAEGMHKKIAGGDPQAEAFYENYAKKAFQDTELGSFEDFKHVVESGSFQEVADRLAISGVEKRFADGRRVDDQTQEMIDERVRSRGIPLKLSQAEASPMLPDKPTTAGERILAEKKAGAEKAEAAAAADPESKMLALKARNARLEFQIESARRDGGTGLFERGVHYENLERALGEGNEVSTVFVDMGFLKYFDQMGGNEVGNDALKTAARMMEQAVAAAGVKGEVYRYGGDEFTIQVEGGAAEATKVIRALDDLRDLSAPIPTGPKSRAEYAPTKLSFNYGLADMAMLDELYRVDAAGGKRSEEELSDPFRVLNIKAELMTKAADVGIEYNKAYSRFMLLIDELRDPAYATDPKRKQQLDAKISFSNKALFAELGGADKLRLLAADRSLEGPALEEEVLDYVVDKVGETREREKGQKELLDLLLAAQTKIAFLTDRLQDVQRLSGVQQHKIDRLQDALTKAQQEKQALVDTRRAIDSAA